MLDCKASRKAGLRRLPPFVLPLACGAFVGLFAVWLLLTPPKEFSAEENRVLTTAPTLTASTLADGTYTAQLGKYFSDQFPVRSHLVRLRALCERALGRAENNGVLFGADGYLVPRGECTEAEYTTLSRNMDALSHLEQRLQDSVPLLAAIVPRSVDINRSRLPSAYQAVDTDTIWRHLAQSADTPVTDLLSPLREAAKKGQAVWYKTDHHWTSEGAYIAYVALGQTLGYTPYERDAFSPQTVSENFLGTTYSRAGLVAAKSDAVTLWRYEGDDDYTVTVVSGSGETRVLQGFYDVAALATKDQYSVFLGGTDACVYIEPPHGTTLPTLLLLKDSYAQSLAPFLARHFRLILIDPRSYRATAAHPTVTRLIQKEQPYAVLLLCGIETLYGEMDLRTLLS